MLNRWRHWIVPILLFFLLGTLPGVSAATITLTAVNDQLLPLTDSTMPTRRNGELYVPYTVFAGTLGVNNALPDAQTLILYNLDNTLTFSLQQNYVYDESGTSYTQPAYVNGSMIYVPVKLVCRAFGLSYSSISSSWPILRIINDRAALSDHDFVTSMESAIARLVNAYQNADTADTGSTTQNTDNLPVTPPAETADVPKPNRVYLAVVGTPNANTADILQALQNHAATATFFLSTDDLIGNDDWIRQIFVAGYPLGLSFAAEDADMLAHLEQANDLLERACGIRTHLVTTSGTVTAALRQTLAAAGYRLWRTTMDGGENRKTAYRAAEAVLQAFQTSDAPVVLRLRHNQNTAQELQYVLSYMDAADISNPTLTFFATPV